jgi:transcriptional regulator with XRE-family HTH domain
LFRFREHVNTDLEKEPSAGMSAMIIPMDKARAGRLLAQRASDLRAVARRMLAARRAAGLRSVDICAGAGITSSQLSNWEAAKSRPRVDQLGLILPFLDVTSDWIYFGDDRGLSWTKREALLAAVAEVEAEARAGLDTQERDVLIIRENKG